MVKHYPNGVMTEHIFSLKEGDQLAMKGPIVKWDYKKNEFKVRINSSRRRWGLPWSSQAPPAAFRTPG